MQASPGKNLLDKNALDRRPGSSGNPSCKHQDATFRVRGQHGMSGLKDVAAGTEWAIPPAAPRLVRGSRAAKLPAPATMPREEGREAPRFAGRGEVEDAISNFCLRDGVGRFRNDRDRSMGA
jgi:hypothetical protein